VKQERVGGRMGGRDALPPVGCAHRYARSRIVRMCPRVDEGPNRSEEISVSCVQGGGASVCEGVPDLFDASNWFRILTSTAGNVSCALRTNLFSR
jgi:hypothetical protein